MLVWAGTRAQSGDRYGSGTLHPGQVLRVSLPLLSPAFRRSQFRRQLPPHPQRHGTDGFTSPPKEGVLRIFSPLKIRRLRSGLYWRTWVLKASTLPLDHRSPSRLLYLSVFLNVLIFAWARDRLCAQTIQPSHATPSAVETVVIWPNSHLTITKFLCQLCY